MPDSPQPSCYFDGRLIPEREAVVPVSELGSQILYDTARTYAGEPRMLAHHLKRIFQGCHYFGFDIGLDDAGLAAAVRATLAANADSAFLAAGGDYLLHFKISGRPLVHIAVQSMLPVFKARARYFREGVHTVTASSQRHVPPQCIDPRLKIPRPWFQLAIRETRMNHPDCWEFPLMLDLDGNLSEFAAGNLFLVIDGALHTPARNILLGCSRHLVCDAAARGHLPLIERDMTLWDMINADEAFMTGTSYGLLPIASVNRIPIGTRTGFGPISQRIHDLFSELVGINLMAQYQRWDIPG